MLYGEATSQSDKIDDLESENLELIQDIEELQSRVNNLNEENLELIQDIEELQSRVNNLNEEIEDTKKDLEEAEKDIDVLNSQIEEKNETIVALESKVDELEKKLEETNLEVYELQKSLNETKDDLHEAKEDIEYLKNLYEIQTSEYAILAVDEDDEGVVVELEIKMERGEDNVLVDITRVIYRTDTQISVRSAFDVSKEYTGYQMNDSEIEVHISNPYEELLEIGGPSAGAAITVSIIHAIENESLTKDVLITGTIEEDGDIGKVGSIEEKVDAAREYGAHTVLVPEGQEIEAEDIEVIGVSNVEEALYYFDVE